MTGFGGLLSRHRRMAFRHPAAPLFLLLPIAVIAVLFVSYLSAQHASAIPAAGAAQVRWLAACWAAAGLPVVLAFPAAMIALQVFAGDRSAGKRRDFGITLLGKGTQTTAYIGVPVLAALSVALLSYAGIQVAVALWTGVAPLPRAVLFGLGYTMLGALHAGLLSVFVVSLLPGGGAYAVLSSLSALVPGFLSGAFIPIGYLPDPLARIVLGFPASHAVSLARQALTWQAATSVFAGASADLARYRSLFGVDLFWGERAILPLWSLLFPAVTALLFLLLSIPLVLRACRTDRIPRRRKEGSQ